MANKSVFLLISVALMVVGVGLAYWGYDLSSGLDSQLNEALSGSSSDGVMIRYIGGAACFVTGLYLFIKK